MNLENIAQGEPWMTPAEHQTVVGLVQSFQQSFSDRAIPETPFLVLRVRDVLVSLTLCRRLELNLSLDPDAPAAVTPLLAGHIGKAVDRHRRALKELEQTANKLVPRADPAPKGTRLPNNPPPAPGNTTPPAPSSGNPSPCNTTPSPTPPGNPSAEANKAVPPAADSHSSQTSHNSPPSQPLPQHRPFQPPKPPLNIPKPSSYSRDNSQHRRP
jgi:hypothetical protein